MTILQSGVIPSTGGYQIERSLRFNSADSAYLNRTLSTPTDNKRWTWSCWLKRSGFGGSGQYLIFTFPDGSNYGYILLTSSHTLEVGGQTGGVSFSRITSAVFRDVSAWYAITVIVDTTLATANDRIKIYVNNVLQTLTGTAPSQNSNLVLNTAVAHRIGAHTTSSNYYLDGYLTEVNFIDGQALTPSSFGETDSNTGVWKPKAYSGTYGTNGFYLKFADNSGTTSTTLGKDSSGNGNNWTPNNFSVTAGVGNDSLVDSPTAYGTDTGVGGEVRGNYATFNPLFRHPSTTWVTTYSEGNLKSSTSNAGSSGAISNIAPTSGKWYCEITCTAVGSATPFVDISTTNSPDQMNTSGEYLPGNYSYGVYYNSAGTRRTNNTATASWGSTWTTNDVLMLAGDCDTGKVWFGKNGTWQASGNPASGTNQAATLTTATPMWFGCGAVSGAAFVANFGQRPFAYTAPSGFKALCTQNLPTPTIGATSTTQANDYFNAVLYTGNSTARSITGVGFQPDFTWIKMRSGVSNHALFDAIRGATKWISSNTTSAEATDTASLTSFDSDGFSLGTGNVGVAVNNNTSTFVAWNWKANGAGSSNSNGTAKSSSVTVDSSTDTVTWNSHGMSDGQKIGFFAATMPGGLSAGTLYYVRDAATNTFKVAASSGGAAIDITSNGTTVTAHTTLTSTVSANATAGFSIVKHINSGAPATIEHGLGVAPVFIINKVYDRTENWRVHFGVANKLLILNSTAAEATDTNIWNNTNPTSNVFSIGTYFSSGDDVISYCFAPVAGYSAFGTYTGNNSTDGPFIYLGFRPKFWMVKRTDSTGDWYIYDSSRSPYNAGTETLAPSQTFGESSFGSLNYFDLLSNGLKIRQNSTNGFANVLNATYIYAAFAENPFKYSLAR